MLLKLEPRGQRSRMWTYLSPVLALGLTVLASGCIFAMLGQPPLTALHTFLISPLSSLNGWSELFVKASPLILIAVGLSLGFRANVWNIGAEGQFVIGAIVGGGIALALPEASFWLLFPTMIVFGILGGMVWAAIPAYLRTRFNANEILTSLMLTYVAELILIYLVTGPWRDPEGYGFPQTALFSAAATAPALFSGYRVHVGVVVALLVALLGWVVLARSVVGFQLRVVGQAPRAARYAGFSQRRLIWLSLLLGGGLAGLAGLFEVSALVGQLTPAVPVYYGFVGIIVAFLGRLHPIGIILAGLVLALSYLGGEAAQMDLGMPNAVAKIFQGILLFMLLACDLLVLFRIRFVHPKPARAAS